MCDDKTPITFDRFNNAYIDYIDGKKFDYYYPLIETTKNTNHGKGVLLRGFPKEIIAPLRKIYGKSELIYMITKKAKTLYLLVNGSNCPQFCNSSILAAGMTVIIYYQGFWYGLLVYDPTKPVLTVPGGVATASEHVLDPNLFFTVAKRETYEETRGNVKTAQEKTLKETVGTVSMNGTLVFCPGIIINNTSDVIKIAKISMKSTYYGYKVPDTYKCFGYKIVIESDLSSVNDKFLRMMFDPTHQLPNGNYQMNFIDNKEINFVYAVKLNIDNETTSNNFTDTMEKIITHTTSTKLESGRISNLHMLLHHVHLSLIKNSEKKTTSFEHYNREEFMKFKLPPSLREMKIRYSSA